MTQCLEQLPFGILHGMRHAGDLDGGDLSSDGGLVLLAQRVYPIAAGYEDCNDADDWRHDPVLKTVVGRLPQTGRTWPPGRRCRALRIA